MSSLRPENKDARSLPDDYARLRAPAGHRVLDLVDRRWGDRKEGERRQLAQILVGILEPLNRPDGKVTDDLRNACEQAVAGWVQRTVPVRDLVEGAANSEVEPGRRFLRLVSARLAREEDGHWWARVTLERADGGLYSVRTASRSEAITDQLRSGAEATVQALRQAMMTRDLFVEVREAGTFDAFATRGAIVAVSVTQGDRQWTSVGVCPDIGNEPVRAAAVAVLNATNRRLGTG